MHRGGTASWGWRSLAHPPPPARHWTALSQPAQGGNSFMGAEKLGPPVATSSALDRLESTCTGGGTASWGRRSWTRLSPQVNLHRGGRGGTASCGRRSLARPSPRVNMHGGGTASGGRRSWSRPSPRVNLHRGRTASRGRTSWARPSPPALHWTASSQPAQGRNSFMEAEKLGPPVATSSALDRLESTCKWGGTASWGRRSWAHQSPPAPPWTALSQPAQRGTASWGRRSWARPSPPAPHWADSSQPAQGGTASNLQEYLGCELPACIRHP
jgi:hypothetical protein